MVETFYHIFTFFCRVPYNKSWVKYDFATSQFGISKATYISKALYRITLLNSCRNKLEETFFKKDLQRLDEFIYNPFSLFLKIKRYMTFLLNYCVVSRPFSETLFLFDTHYTLYPPHFRKSLKQLSLKR